MFRVKAAALFLLATLVACQQGRNPNRDDGRVVRGLPTGNTPSIQPVPGGSAGISPAANRLWGEINSSQLDAQVRQFVSVFMSPDQLGPIQGLRFWGDVMLASGGTLSQIQMSGGSQNIHPSSRIVIAIYDSWVGQPSQNGGINQPVYVNISPEARGQASGSIQGNQVQLRFQDNMGVIELVGQFDQNQFIGQIRYQNSNSTSGVFEQFTVPTCGFFRC